MLIFKTDRNRRDVRSLQKIKNQRIFLNFFFGQKLAPAALSASLGGNCTAQELMVRRFAISSENKKGARARVKGGWGQQCAAPARNTQRGRFYMRRAESAIHLGLQRSESAPRREKRPFLKGLLLLEQRRR